MERMELTVGPIRIEVIEPLQILKVTLSQAEGLACELTFEGRAFPIEEPRFTRRNGPRMFMDYTRLTQNVRVSGWTEVDGDRRETGAGWAGTRDRSWGIRPVGAQDPQPTPGAGLAASSGSGRRSTSPTAASTSTSMPTPRASPGTRGP